MPVTRNARTTMPQPNATSGIAFVYISLSDVAHSELVQVITENYAWTGAGLKTQLCDAREPSGPWPDPCTALTCVQPLNPPQSLCFLPALLSSSSPPSDVINGLPLMTATEESAHKS